MHNYKMSLAYDGTKYLGWQIQTSTPLKTIQGKLQHILSILFDEPIHVIASGRTDAGVHAHMQVVNFHTTTFKTCEEISAYMRDFLPNDIAILEIKEASERFHARFNCHSKRYHYYIDTGYFPNPFTSRYAYHIPETLNTALIEQAIPHLLGEHDFKAFTSLKSKKKSTVREIYTITLKKTPNGFVLCYHGNGFLQHMVRLLTGTLLQVGLGHISPETVAELLQKQDRSLTGPIAPSHGLFLEEVYYTSPKES